MAALSGVQAQKWLILVCRIVGYVLLAAVGLVVASPVLLFLLFLLGVLAVSALFFVGCIMGLAAIAAVILHHLLGLLFWFLMIFTGFGALLFGIGMVGSLCSGSGDEAGTGKIVQSRTACVPWSWLLVGFLLGHWWGDGNGG